MFDQPALIQYVLVMVAVGIVTSDLAIGVVRGRFGTPQRRAALDLRELARSDEVPPSADRIARAQSMGHSTAEHPSLRGVGVLWLDDDSLGFVLRRPRYPLVIDLGSVHSVAASRVVRRPGVRPVRSAEPLLVLEWWTPSGLAMISFRVDGAQDWVRHIEQLRTPREIVVPGDLAA